MHFIYHHNLDIAAAFGVSAAISLLVGRFCGTNSRAERDYWLLRQERVREMKR